MLRAVRPSPDDRFNMEVLKLLAQLAWGDNMLARAEADAIYGLGRSWLVPEEELQELRERLMEGKRLFPPDLGLLRSRPEAVLEAARALAVTDGRLDAEEQELLDQVRAYLEGH